MKEEHRRKGIQGEEIKTQRFAENNIIMSVSEEDLENIMKAWMPF